MSYTRGPELRELYIYGVRYRTGRDWDPSQNEPDELFPSNPRLSLNHQAIDPKILEIKNRIKQLRQKQFSRMNKNGSILIQDVTDVNMISPVDPWTEANIQALRYLNGMLLIMKYSEENVANENLERIKDAYNEFSMTGATSNDLHVLAERFADILILSFNIDIEHARKQVTMARDLSSMLEDQPRICTISTLNDKVTIEVSTNARISKEYYEQLEEAEKKKRTNGETTWLDHTKKFAGVAGQQETWLDAFFTNPEAETFSMQRLQEHGRSAPPSARWLLLPGNVQDVITYTADLTRNNTIDTNTEKTTKFTRMGITSAYDIEDIKEQEHYAVAMLVEIFSQRIVSDYLAYYKSYGALASRNFYVNYETLLSPHYLEASLYEKGVILPRHKDNNAAFVDMAKRALEIAQVDITRKVNEIVSDVAYNEVLYAGVPNPDLIFSQTNSAVNKLADIPGSSIKNPGLKVYEKDKELRKEKISGVTALLTKIEKLYPAESAKILLTLIESNNNIHNYKNFRMCLNYLKEHLTKNQDSLKLTPPVINQIIQRVDAAVHMQQLLNKNPPYDQLPHYQRNIMQAAFELITVGDQGTTLMGCKSARDRTAIMAGAIKTMQENPEAMHDWKILNAGIVKSLIQGHHFRAMAHHVAVVKINDVHPYFIKQMPEELINAINKFKIFSKKLDKVEAELAPETAQAILNKINEKIVEFVQGDGVLNNDVYTRGNGVVRRLQGGEYTLPKHLARIYDEIQSVETNNVNPSMALKNVVGILKTTTSKVHQFFTYGRDQRTQNFYNALSDLASSKDVVPQPEAPRQLSANG